MGVQIPCGVHSRVEKENVVCEPAQAFGRGVQTTGAAQGMRDSGRASNAGSCAYADSDPAKVCGIPSGGIHERKERNPHCQSVRRTQAEFCGAEFLGERVFCFDSGSGSGPPHSDDM